jgi:large subunit ribosomal protein L21
MYAIVDIAGKQFKVEANKYVYAPLLEGEAGKDVKFDQVLLIDDGSSVSVGSPVIKGASISGKIVEHVKGEKDIVFKKKRRKGYAKKNGHRQNFTRVMIEAISVK